MCHCEVSVMERSLSSLALGLCSPHAVLASRFYRRVCGLGVCVCALHDVELSSCVWSCTVQQCNSGFLIRRRPFSIRSITTVLQPLCGVASLIFYICVLNIVNKISTIQLVGLHIVRCPLSSEFKPNNPLLFKFQCSCIICCLLSVRFYFLSPRKTVKSNPTSLFYDVNMQMLLPF